MSREPKFEDSRYNYKNMPLWAEPLNHVEWEWLKNHQKPKSRPTIKQLKQDAVDDPFMRWVLHVVEGRHNGVNRVHEKYLLSKVGENNPTVEKEGFLQYNLYATAIVWRYATVASGLPFALQIDSARP